MLGGGRDHRCDITTHPSRRRRPWGPNLAPRLAKARVRDNGEIFQITLSATVVTLSGAKPHKVACAFLKETRLHGGKTTEQGVGQAEKQASQLEPCIWS